jgi:hypothetical protein
VGPPRDLGEIKRRRRPATSARRAARDLGEIKRRAGRRRDLGSARGRDLGEIKHRRAARDLGEIERRRAAATSAKSNVGAGPRPRRNRTSEGGPRPRRNRTSAGGPRPRRNRTLAGGPRPRRDQALLRRTRALRAAAGARPNALLNANASRGCLASGAPDPLGQRRNVGGSLRCTIVRFASRKAAARPASRFHNRLCVSSRACPSSPGRPRGRAALGDVECNVSQLGSRASLHYLAGT